MALGIWRKFKQFIQRLQGRWTKSPMKPVIQKMWSIAKPIIPNLVQAVPGGEKVVPIVQKAIPTAEKILGIPDPLGPEGDIIGMGNPLTSGQSLKDLASGGSDYTRLRKI